MGKYIKKHRRQFAGVTLPILFLLILGAASLSVFPGWLRPSYGVIGAPCTVVTLCPLGSCDSTAAALLSACDLCAGEICSADTAGSFCTQGTAPLPTCPNTNTNIPQPGCYAQCINTIVFGQSFGTATVGCGPADQFCQDLSGGTLANDCRTGICLPGATSVDIGNPTGCDYTYDTANTDCINCASPTPQTVNCGNGVCEQGIGESFTSCPLDCAAPGFDAIVPQADLDVACDNPPATITFSGNLPGGETCEDGDICTTNVCDPQLPQCNVAPAGCDDTTIDFCCPAACTSANDADCLTPESCEPTPTPIPTPPVTGLTLHGDGCSSLHAGAAYPSGSGSLLLMAGGGFLGWLRLRRKAS